MIVVDTNIIAYATFQTEFTDAIMKLHEMDPQWEVPVLWRSEFLNVVSQYLRNKLINLDQAVDAVEAAQNFVGTREHLMSPFALLEFINASSLSSYDCEYVALAQRFSTRLITYDKKILHSFPSIAIKPEDFLALEQ